MFAKHFAKTIPTKINSKKNDAAPMICFIDVLQSSNFPHFVIPEPCRIDKLINGSPTAHIFPTHRACIYRDDGDTIITYNYRNLFQAMFSNFVHYAKIKSKEILYREIPPRNITNWWNRTISLQPQIHSYCKDQEFILQSFLEAYASYESARIKNPSFSKDQLQNKEKKCLLAYCDRVITYFNERIEENSISIDYRQKTIEKRMYKVKKEKYYPDIFEFDLIEHNPQKDRPRRFQKAFIPVMIYDDILESFYYNQEILQRMLGEEDQGDNHVDESTQEENVETIDITGMSVISFQEFEDKQILRTFPKSEMDSLKSIEEEIHSIQLSDLS